MNRILIAFFAFLVLFTATDDAACSTWIVYSFSGGDFKTIQEALDVAAAGDTIIVYPGPPYQEHDLIIDKQLTISALAGPELTIIDAQGLGRCFFIESSAGDVEIEGFTLTNGYAGGSGTNGCGGAIYCASNSARISGCRITDSGASISGGGIYFYYSDAAVEYCLLEADSAGTSGGGIGTFESSPTILNCTVAGCAAGSYGGGIYAGMNSHPIITNTITAFSTSGEGVYVETGLSDATVTCCDVYGNAAGEYGGSITDQTGINGNISADPLFCDDRVSIFGLQEISPCLPENNSCSVQIGYGPRCVFSTWYVTADGTGDAPDIQAAIDLTIDGDTVLVAAGTYTGTGNRDIEFRGKGILVTSESGRESTIVDCQSIAGDNHAGFYFTSGEDSTSILEGITITHASLNGVSGQNSSPVIRNCRFTENNHVEALYGRGGALYFDGGRPRVSGCDIADNHGDSHGGIESKDAELLLENCTVTDNSGNTGGIIFTSFASSHSNISGCTFSRNHSSGSGGAIRIIYTDNVTIEDCQIFDNTAVIRGGAIDGGTIDTLTMINTIVAHNAVTEPAGIEQGGGLYLRATASITGCTIVLNSAGNQGSGIYIEQQSADNTVSIARTLVAFNHESTGIYLEVPMGEDSDVQISCSDVFGHAEGDYGGDIPDQTGSNDNLSMDPFFCDTLAGNFSLFNDSPCAPAHSPCGELIGRNDVACFMESPDLTVTEYSVSDDQPEVGDMISFTVKVKNIGAVAADTFMIGWYQDLSSPPPAGSAPTLDTLVTGLAVGDSVIWTTQAVTSAYSDEWTSWFLADAEGDIRESDENNNTGGPLDVIWDDPSTDVEDDLTTPTVTSLAGIWPNPFNPSTSIRFSLRDKSNVRITINDVSGRLVRTLQDGIMNAGWHTVVWNGRSDNGTNVASGVFFCRMSADGIQETKKMVLLR